MKFQNTPTDAPNAIEWGEPESFNISFSLARILSKCLCDNYITISMILISTSLNYNVFYTVCIEHMHHQFCEIRHNFLGIKMYAYGFSGLLSYLN